MIKCNFLEGISRNWVVLMGILSGIVLLLSASVVWQQQRYDHLHPIRIWASEQQDFSAWLVNQPRREDLIMPLNTVIATSSLLLGNSAAFTFDHDSAVLAGPWQGEFNTMLRWLFILQQQYGIKINQLDVIASPTPGMVTLAHASFSR